MEGVTFNFFGLLSDATGMIDIIFKCWTQFPPLFNIKSTWWVPGAWKKNMPIVHKPHRTARTAYTMNGSHSLSRDLMRRMVSRAERESRPCVNDSRSSSVEPQSCSRVRSTMRSNSTESLQRLIDILEMAESIVLLNDEEEIFPWCYHDKDQQFVPWSLSWNMHYKVAAME